MTKTETHPRRRRRVLLLLLFAALLLVSAKLRPAVEVTVGGETVGRFAPRTAYRSAEAARAAALEITGRASALPEDVRLRLCLTAQPCSRDAARLSRELLAAVPGVTRLWIVCADGEALGAVDDPSVLEELRGALVDTYASPRTVSVCVAPQPELRESFARAESVQTQAALGGQLRQRITVRTVELTEDALPEAFCGLTQMRDF